MGHRAKMYSASFCKKECLMWPFVPHFLEQSLSERPLSGTSLQFKISLIYQCNTEEWNVKYNVIVQEAAVGLK